jgi:cyclopropane-fatty-acyl-phospholipid synthase
VFAAISNSPYPRRLGGCSNTQNTYTEGRIKAAGFEGRIRVHLLDYRAIPAEFEQAFDAFVSIEMIEVGIP